MDAILYIIFDICEAFSILYIFTLQEEEVYICIYSHRKADTILFHHQGGVDIGDVDAKALKLDIPVGSELPDRSTLINKLLINVTDDKKV